MRQQISRELNFSLVAEMLPLSSKTGSIELKPVVKLPDLERLVLHYLDQHEVAGALTWHNGELPGDEMWVKVGGHHGGGSFKLPYSSLPTSKTAMPSRTPFHSLYLQLPTQP